jgi:hypothetical protein
LLLFKLLKFIVLLIALLLKTDKGSGAEILLISMFVFKVCKLLLIVLFLVVEVIAITTKLLLKLSGGCVEV